MKYITINCCLLLLFFISTINQIQCLCVLDSDFGFSLNCNFKNSGLFRVRNLGGIKAHFGLGFSLGDELGFPESLGNVEGTKKRSLDIRTGTNAIGVLPASAQRPSVPVMKVRQIRPQATVSPSNLMQIQTLIPRPVMSTPHGFIRRQQPPVPAMTEAQSLPLGVPRFKTIPKETLKVKENMFKMQTIQPPFPKYQDNRQLTGAERFLKTMASTGVQTIPERVSPVYAEPVPAFQALPSSITTAQLMQPTKVEYFPKDDMPKVDLKGHTIEELAAAANVSVEFIKAAIKIRQQQLLVEKKPKGNESKYKWKKFTSTTSATSTTPSITSSDTTEAVTTRTTTSKVDTTPYAPKKKVVKKFIKNGHKVMNAPREYYPAGYDKNYDDNFTSKVDLPATSFHCGDQKHFPGLYADQELGCMVFHVCALTDDGLIMKSFLCPESTLFDQTILKCNWWFYTDCKSSKSLYDSNLPVSKSYQLMKSLSYFNKNYKSSGNATLTSTLTENAEVRGDNGKVTIITAKDQQ